MKIIAVVPASFHGGAAGFIVQVRELELRRAFGLASADAGVLKVGAELDFMGLGDKARAVEALRPQLRQLDRALDMAKGTIELATTDGADFVFQTKEDSTNG